MRVPSVFSVSAYGDPHSPPGCPGSKIGQKPPLRLSNFSNFVSRSAAWISGKKQWKNTNKCAIINKISCEGGASVSLFNALILGLIQGVAEFLPISSSGHLAIAQELLGFGVEGSDDMFFDVLLHLGTLAAVFVAYWADIKEMILEFIRTIQDVSHGGMPEKIPPARRMILLVVVGTLPLFLVLPIQDFVEGLSS